MSRIPLQGYDCETIPRIAQQEGITVYDVAKRHFIEEVNHDQ